jgi:hypothetical protein
MTDKSQEKSAPKLELVETPSPESIFDDLDSLRKESVIQVKRKVLKVNLTVDKPKNNIFFRCHQTIFQEDAPLIIGPDDDYYFVHPCMKDHPALKPRIRVCTIAVVYSWPDGIISLWPVPQSEAVKCWKTAKAAYERSKTEWVQMIWNDAESDYDVTPAENITVEPMWSRDLNFVNLLKIGFANKIISDAEHPYVRQLRGFSD